VPFHNKNPNAGSTHKQQTHYLFSPPSSWRQKIIRLCVRTETKGLHNLRFVRTVTIRLFVCSISLSHNTHTHNLGRSLSLSLSLSRTPSLSLIHVQWWSAREMLHTCMGWNRTPHKEMPGEMPGEILHSGSVTLSFPGFHHCRSILTLLPKTTRTKKRARSQSANIRSRKMRN